MMIISLLDSMRKSIVRDLNEEFTPPNIKNSYEEIKFLKPVRAMGTVRALQGIVEIDATLDALLQLTCSRCLTSFKKDVKIAVREKFARQVEEDDFDTIQLSPGDTVDITDILTKEIISSLPIQFLCSEDCKGLCQECGANLNEGDCDCDKEQVDVRLEALRDLFKEV